MKKYKPFMGRIIIALFMAIFCSVGASAQAGLEINKIFGGKYSSDPTVTETLISDNGSFLTRNQLRLMASFKAPASRYASMIQKLVEKDGAGAIGKNIKYKNGQLYFAFYMLKPIGSEKNKINRYIYYLNTAAVGEENVLVVYLEGKASERSVSNLIQNMSKKVGRR